MKRWRDQIDAWLDEGREERKREKKKGAIPEVNEKGPKNQTSTPESIKIVPESTQKGPTTKPREIINHSNVFKMILDPPWGAIFRLSCYSQVPS